MYKQPTNALYFYDVFYLYVQHVLAIFMVMIQEYNCS